MATATVNPPPGRTPFPPMPSGGTETGNPKGNDEGGGNRPINTDGPNRGFDTEARDRSNEDTGDFQLNMPDEAVDEEPTKPPSGKRAPAKEKKAR